MKKEDPSKDDDEALTILKNRLAKGEITIEEFDKLKAKLADNDEFTRKEIIKVKQDLAQLGQKQLEIQKKSPGQTILLAALCGLVGILGIGHFYVKSKGKGVGFLIGGLFLDFVFILLLLAPVILPQNPGVEQFQQSIVTNSFAILYGLIYIGLYLIQIFDALRSCTKYNLIMVQKISLKGQQIASYRSKILLVILLGILVVIGSIIVNDTSQNIPKLKSLQQQEQAANQEYQNSQTLQGYSQAIDNWKKCAQGAGSDYFSICGNPPTSPFSNQPVDCSLSENHWLCNPYYTEPAGQKQSSNQNSSGSVPIIKTTQDLGSYSSGVNAVITTKFGNIGINLLDKVAPRTVANFEKLSQSGFYDGLLFHRIMPGFVIQGGDPNTRTGSRNTWGTGDAGYTIPPEFNDLSFTKYTVGMARGSEVNSGSSQFFITVDDASFLDGKYTLFGQVTFGQDVVDKIVSLPTDSTTNQPTNPEDARIVKVVIQK